MRRIILSFVLASALLSCTKPNDTLDNRQAAADPSVSSVTTAPVWSGGSNKIKFSFTVTVPDAAATDYFNIVKYYPSESRWKIIDQPETGSYIAYDHGTEYQFAQFYQVEYSLECVMKDGHKVGYPRFKVQ